jgi:hypothetical protein
LKLGGPLNVLHGLAGRFGDGVDVPIALNGKTFDRLSGFGNAFNNLAGPFRLYTNHNHGRHIGIGSRANQRSEKKLQILTKLQSAVRVRKRHGSFDIIGDRLTRGVGKIIQRQYDCVISNPYSTVFASIPYKFRYTHFYHLFVFKL